MKPDKSQHRKPQRRAYPEELKKEAVQMLLDGHSASSWLTTLASATPRCCTAGKPRSLARKGRRHLPWRCEYGSSKSNSGARTESLSDFLVRPVGTGGVAFEKNLRSPHLHG
jgi:hypothetical protein